jgi:hypothetical protein
MNRHGRYLCMLCVILLCTGCYKNAPMQPQPNLSQHQIKLTFKPDEGMTYLTRQDIDKFYNIALSTGAELGYRSLQSEQEHGQIKFTRATVNNAYLTNMAVAISITDDRQTAYVYITTSSQTEAAAQNAAREYRDKYKTKLLN